MMLLVTGVLLRLVQQVQIDTAPMLSRSTGTARAAGRVKCAVVLLRWLHWRR